MKIKWREKKKKRKSCGGQGFRDLKVKQTFFFFPALILISMSFSNDLILGISVRRT